MNGSWHTLRMRPLVERLFLLSTAQSHIVARSKLKAHLRDCF